MKKEIFIILCISVIAIILASSSIIIDHHPFNQRIGFDYQWYQYMGNSTTPVQNTVTEICPDQFPYLYDMMGPLDLDSYEVIESINYIWNDNLAPIGFEFDQRRNAEISDSDDIPVVTFTYICTTKLP